MSYPMYVVVPEKDYNEMLEYGEEFVNILSDSSLYEDSDFSAIAGNSGYVSGRETNLSVEGLTTKAKELKRYFGSDICHVEENGLLVFEEDAPIKFAARKIDGIKKLINDMTPKQYIDLGEYKLRDAIRTNFILIHTYGYDDVDDQFTQSADRFIISTLHYNGGKYGDKRLYRVFVPQLIWVHD